MNYKEMSLKEFLKELGQLSKDLIDDSEEAEKRIRLLSGIPYFSQKLDALDNALKKMFKDSLPILDEWDRFTGAKEVEDSIFDEIEKAHTEIFFSLKESEGENQ